MILFQNERRIVSQHVLDPSTSVLGVPIDIYWSELVALEEDFSKGHASQSVRSSVLSSHIPETVLHLVLPISSASTTNTYSPTSFTVIERCEVILRCFRLNTIQCPFDPRAKQRCLSVESKIVVRGYFPLALYTEKSALEQG